MGPDLRRPVAAWPPGRAPSMPAARRSARASAPIEVPEGIFERIRTLCLKLAARPLASSSRPKIYMSLPRLAEGTCRYRFLHTWQECGMFV
jgi:hypothetical protein